MLGVLDDHKMPPGQTVPGTVLLDNPLGEADENISGDFKRRGEVILVPQPSDSPNDPLNWPQWKKDTAMCILGFAAAMALSMMTMLGPGFRPMSAYFHVSYDQLSTYMIGIVILFTGTTTFFTAAAASVWGKRPVFIISSFFLLICCIWGYAAKTFVSLAVMRAISGIASAPVETLVTSTVYDMYFVHERGRKLAIWGVMLLSGMHVNSLIFSLIIDKTGPLVWIPPMKKIPGVGSFHGHGPINSTQASNSSMSAFKGKPLNSRAEPGFAAGHGLTGARNGTFDINKAPPGVFKGMYQHMGIKWTFFVCAIIWIFVLALMYFFVPESLYVRKTRALPKIGATEEVSSEKTSGKGISVVERASSTTSSEDEPEQKMSRRDELRLFRGRITDRSFFKACVQPLPLVVFPAVLFSTVVYGAFMAWLVILHTVQFNVLSRPPYMFQPLMLGVIGLPAWGLSLVLMPFSGWLADWLIKALAKRNKGVYEPEFRLWLMIPACIISSLSFIGFGWAVQHQKSPAMIVAFSTLQSGAIPFASSSSFLYVIDCHPENSNEAFVIINLFKALIIFFASLKTNGWYEQAGASAVFNTVTALNVGVSLLTIPTYVYGKRFRSLVARNETLRRWTKVKNN